MKKISTTCCIAGGGPAGVMLGYLLAKAGIDVIVLEKHADFLRDFRGDTVHPSTLQIINELGLLDQFLQLPHQKISKVSMSIYGQMFTMGDLSSLNTKTPYIAMMPQWDFLNFMVDQAKKLPNFQIIMQAKVIDVIHQGNKICGALVNQPDGDLTILSKLLIGADGRHSTVRLKANLALTNLGVAIDALWFRLSRIPSDPSETFGSITPGNLMVMINRETYWQCAYIIPKGKIHELHTEGLEKFKNKVAEIRPLLKDRMNEIQDWDQIKLLEVQVNRLQKWYKDGLLCIGDAAHAMSPVGGVGINLAIQDAVAASNILTQPLLSGSLTEKDLAAVQQRRNFPTIMTQKLQIAMHKNMIYKIIDKDRPFTPPFMLKLVTKFPFLSKIFGYVIGMGFRPEHVKYFNK